MRKLITLFMNEPAFAIGVLTAVGIAVLKIAGGGAFTAEDLIAVFAPVATAAGVRPLVTPASSPAS